MESPAAAAARAQGGKGTTTPNSPRGRGPAPRRGAHAQSGNPRRLLGIVVGKGSEGPDGQARAGGEGSAPHPGARV